MRPLFTLLSLVSLAARRLWNHRLLMLCLLIGLVTAVGLLTSIPFYADAVQNRLLQGELTEAGTYRPPFAFLWRYIGAWNGDIGWEEYGPVNQYLTQQAAGAIGLPENAMVRHVSTAKLRLYAAEDGAFAANNPLLWTGIGFVTGLAEKIELVEGTFPAAASDAVEVLVKL